MTSNIGLDNESRLQMNERLETFRVPRRRTLEAARTTSSILAETVRVACVDAAIHAYEDAGIRGLCADGRWEAALAAIRQLDLSGMHEPPAGRGPDQGA